MEYIEKVLLGLVFSLVFVGGVCIFTNAFSSIGSVSTDDELTASLINNVISKVDNIKFSDGIMEISGNIKFPTTTISCNSTNKGIMKFSGDSFYGCAGSSWITMEGRYCGDSIIDPGETCDDGGSNLTSSLYGLSGDIYCDISCSSQLARYCGDGSIDGSDGEVCDNGGSNSSTSLYILAGGSYCDTSCATQTARQCGDGTIDSSDGETCDDGDLDDGDGCSSSCQLEYAYCSQSDSSCSATDAVDCQWIYDNMPLGEGSSDGAYWVDLDGSGGNSPFKLYCDMTTEGGGWIDILATFNAGIFSQKSITNASKSWSSNTLYLKANNGTTSACNEGANIMINLPSTLSFSEAYYETAGRSRAYTVNERDAYFYDTSSNRHRVRNTVPGSYCYGACSSQWVKTGSLVSSFYNNSSGTDTTVSNNSYVRLSADRNCGLSTSSLFTNHYKLLVR